MDLASAGAHAARWRCRPVPSVLVQHGCRLLFSFILYTLWCKKGHFLEGPYAWISFFVLIGYYVTAAVTRKVRGKNSVESGAPLPPPPGHHFPPMMARFMERLQHPLFPWAMSGRGDFLRMRPGGAGRVAPPPAFPVAVGRKEKREGGPGNYACAFSLSRFSSAAWISAIFSLLKG